MIRRPPRSTRTDTLFPDTNALPICPAQGQGTSASRSLDFTWDKRVGMGKESVRYINKIKLLHRFHLCSGKVVRYGLFTNGPGHDVHIVLFQQSLEPVQLAAQPLLSIAIEKRSEEHTSELQSLMRTSYAV